MKRKGVGINPLLVTIMTGVELQESEVPRLTMLPGITGRMVYKRITKLNSPHPPKKQRL
ncbi:hypothetical protein [Paenibacillus riograndensis]|uniref:Uncharacterized protein n=1 Tax=Paenibacillus riograndensis SBR5 TaxID=1073571 RepID=A0A0E3WHQ7_9BACL|nr:hypothetical protein [Paenibacillus riograndensis]CQR55708.1 hypothetical protein PRIO_3305 [Paenibacillus riograndensis SBR5]